jgi:MFS family permease
MNAAPSHVTPPISLVASKPLLIVSVLGIAQILSWGSSYYLLAVLAKPIADGTDWPLAWVIGGLSVGLLTAGFASPRIGDSIQRLGGRPVLAVSSILLGCGLIGLGLAPSLPVYIMSWLVLGVGMGAGLYDAAFSTLGRLFGQQARTAIATLTLFGGFASTVCWPLSAALVSGFGWRVTCLIYAGIQLVLLLPLYIFGLPKEDRRQTSTTPSLDEQLPRAARPRSPIPGSSMLLFVLLAAAITVSSMISTVVSVHLLSLLHARDIVLGVAVALGAIVGPAQVGARAIEMMISRFHHPIWTMVASTLFVAIGIGALWARLPIISAALVFYGAGIGLESIARGTLPLALFGEGQYAEIMGRIARPNLIAQAASPSIGALLMQQLGADGTLAALFAMAILDVMLVIALFALLPTPSSPSVRTDVALS